MKELEIIKIVAMRARRVIENNKDDRFIGWTNKKETGLACFCGVASLFLQDLLTDFGIYVDIGLVDTIHYAHCFNIYNNYIIDITATQFDETYEDVMFYNYKQQKSPYFHQNYSIMKDKYLECDWAVEDYDKVKQSYFNDYTKLIKEIININK